MNMALGEVLGSDFIPKDIRADESLSAHTSFKTGGRAKTFVEISSINQLQKLIPHLNLVDVPYFILGRGTNTLAADSGFDGVILHMGAKFSKTVVKGDKIIAQGGALLSDVAQLAAQNGLTGLEFAAGIPGSIGGAAVMNAGAYGGEMSQIIESLDVVDANGQILTLDAKTMEFSYRHSIIKTRNFCVCSVTLKLMAGEASSIREKMKELLLKRAQKQPLEFPSAGSAFKRPATDTYAGKLIMDAGLSGHKIGGAAVSKKHCGFIINEDNATSADVYGLIRLIQKVISDRSGITLEPEIVFLGNFS